MRIISEKYFGRASVGFIATAIFIWPAIGAETAAPIPNLTGQWGRDWFLLEPPASGPGPIGNINRKADGKLDFFTWVGDYTNPILRPEAAGALKRRGELSLGGTVAPDPANQCWPQTPTHIVNQMAVQILQQKNKVTFLYVEDHKVRHVSLDVPHPMGLTPTWQGHSVGHYEGDTLVIDTIGIKTGALSILDYFGTPHSEALHIVERYRLIDGAAAAEAQETIVKANNLDSLDASKLPYEAISPFHGRGPIDPDTTKKGLQVEIRVEDSGVFTTPWSGRVTYRPVTGDWPEIVCAEAPRMFGTDTVIPTADTPDF